MSSAPTRLRGLDCKLYLFIAEVICFEGVISKGITTSRDHVTECSLNEVIQGSNIGSPRDEFVTYIAQILIPRP